MDVPESAVSELGVESVEVRLLEEPPQRWLGSLWLRESSMHVNYKVRSNQSKILKR